MTSLRTRNATWREADRHLVEEAYPESSLYYRRNRQGAEVEVCRVTMEPIPDTDELSIILADLHEAESANIGPLGKIRHSPHCKFDLANHRLHLPTVRLTNRPFKVELEYPSIFWGDAGSVHPRLRVLNPEISIKTHPLHPHLYIGGLAGDSWACPIWAQDATWEWERGGAVNYLDNCSIWLLKTEVWAATGGRVFADFGQWVGPATSHQPLDILQQTNLTGPCPCGHGRKFEDCCFVNQCIRAISLNQK